MNVLKGIKTEMSSSDIMVSTTDVFEVKAAASLYIAIKGSELPKLQHFAESKKNANECVQFLSD